MTRRASCDPAKSVGLLLGRTSMASSMPCETLEVEDHVGACEVCRERVALDRALRGSLKKAVKTTAPDDVRARMLAAMAGESAGSRPARADSELETDAERDSALDATAGRASSAGRRPSMLRHWRTMLPLASAAALVMAWGAAGKQPVAQRLGRHDGARRPERRSRSAASSRSTRTRCRPSSRTRSRSASSSATSACRSTSRSSSSRRAERSLRRRPSPARSGRRARGDAPVRGRSRATAACSASPCSSTTRAQVQIGGAHLAPRAVGTSEVRAGRADGYSVAVTQHGGVGYAMASDIEIPRAPRASCAVVDRGE